MALRDLVANLVARTDKFDRPMQKSTKVVDRLKRGIGGASRSLVNMTSKAAKFGTIMGGVAAAGLAYFVKQEMEALDATAKMASQIGLASQSLLEYHHAAGLGGVETESFNKALRTMNQRIGEAVARQSGMAFDAFEQLGLDAERLEQAGADQALLMIADALKKVDSTAQQLDIAKNIMGRSGVELLPMLREGSKGISEMRQEFRDLFGVMEEADFKAIEMANDQIAGVKLGVRGFIAQLTGQLAPAIAAVAKRLKEWIKGIDMRSWAKSFVDTMITGAQYVMGVFDQLQVGWLKLQKAIEMVLGAINRANAERLNLAATVDFSGSQQVYADLVTRAGEAEFASRQNFANANNIDVLIRRMPDFNQSIESWGERIRNAMDDVSTEAQGLAKTQLARIQYGGTDGPIAEAPPPAVVRKTIESVNREIERPSVRVTRSLDAESQEGFEAILSALLPRNRQSETDEIKKHTKKTAEETEDLNRFMQTKLPGMLKPPVQVAIPG